MIRQPSDTKNQLAPQQGAIQQQPLLNIPSFHDKDENTTGNKPWWRRRGSIITIVVVLLVLLIGSLLLSLLSRRTPVTYQFQHATQGDIALTISATGPVQTNAVYNLVFSGTSAKITELNAKVGQKVTQGQVLAQVDKTALQDAVDQQQQAVTNAQNNLNAAQASANSSQTQASSNVNNSQTTLQNAQNNQSAGQNQSQTSINSAQIALDNANTSLDSAKKAADAQKQTAATQHTQAVTNCQTQATADASKTPAPPSNEATCTQLADDQYNQSITQADQSVASAQTQVNNAQAQLNSAKASATANATTAQGQVNSAQSGINQAQAGAGATNASAQNQVTSAQAQLASAQKQLAAAQHNLDNATLKAPHNGIITQVNGTVGGQPGSPANASTSTSSGGTFIQIVDLSTLQVQANINESDTANLKVGETAIFTVNAYGDRQFQGTISTVSPIGQTVSNVVTYPVTIDVDMSGLKGANLMPNMTANITVTVLQRKNVLQIPVNAINFARLTSSGSATNGTQLLKKPDATNALNQARQQLSDLETRNPDILAENPIPAFIVERLGNKFVAKAVILGVSDGTSYEVLAGLTPDELFISGTQTGNLPGSNGGSGSNG